MSLFDEDGLRAIIAEEVAKALRREASALENNTTSDVYLPVAEASRIAAVAPCTIRTWMDEGRLGRYHAGRELRVRRSELEAFLRTSPSGVTETGLSPEAEADRFFLRRRIQPRRG